MACLALALKAAWLFAGVAAAQEPLACQPRKVLVAAEVEGREVVAAGIAWPRGAAGRALPKGRLYPTVTRPDRYERWHGFVFEEGAREPVQAEWLRQGAAFADPRGLGAVCRDTLLAAEAEARRAGLGLWRETRIERAADATLARRVDRFAVVEGEVVSVGDRARTLYLNFGTFWRQDFTVRIEKRDLRRHPELLARLARSTGRTVRVRGRLALRDGPFMKVRDAGQVEFAERPVR